MNTLYECLTCSRRFTDAGPPAACRCPSCGGSHLIRFPSVAANLTPRLDASTEVRQKDPSRSGTRRYPREVIEGISINDDERRVFKRRVIDRELDRYEELLVDKTSGATLTDKKHRLSEHVGCGSAKEKKKT